MSGLLNRTKSFPEWFVFQEIRDERAKRLDTVNYMSLVNRRTELFSSLRTSERGSFRFLFDKTENIQSHTMLIFGVCMDPRLSSWFIENEGDLFDRLFVNEKWENKVPILDFLFPYDGQNPTWMTLDELSNFLNEDIGEKLALQEKENQRRRTATGTSYMIRDAKGLNKLIAIDFRDAAYLVKNRKALLYKGWAIGPMISLQGTVKRKYQSRLDEKLDDFAERIQTEAGGAIKKLSKEIHEYLNKNIKSRGSAFNVDNFVLEGNFEDHLKMFPPCIQDLLATVNEIGYIGHWERFQLGIFLKTTGMDVDDQLQFWFEKAVDNVDMSFADFKQRAGYVIRHIYGLEGGKIDYQMPSCSNIETKMYCTFRHQDINNISENIRGKVANIPPAQRDEKRKIANQVMDAVDKGLPRIACAHYLNLLMGARLTSINHPLIYLRVASERQEQLKKQQKPPEKKENEPENKED